MTAKDSDGLSDSSDDVRRLLVESAANFAGRELSPGRLRGLWGEGAEFNPTVWKRLAEMGWTGLVLPEPIGGYGLGLPDAVALLSELSKPLLPEPLIAGALAPSLIIGRAPESPLRDELAERLCDGTMIAALAWDRDGDFGNVVSSHHPKGIALRGTVTHVTPGSSVDGYLVPTTGEAGIYWLPVGAPGIVTERHSRPDCGSVATLRIETVVAPTNRLVGADQFASVLAEALDWALVAASAELLGLMRGALEMTLIYMKTRKQFGREIGSFQALQHRVVNLHLQQELASAAIEHTAEVIATTTDPRTRSRAASRAKARASDAALLIAREAIQLHGGIGFTEEHDIGLYLKRAIVLSAWLGNGSAHVRRYAALAQ